MGHEEKEDVLDDFSLEVKKIEEEAEQIIKDANSKKDQMIADAKTESAGIILRKQEELEKKKEEKIKKARLKIDEEKAELMKKAEKDADILEKGGKKNIPKAASYVLEQLEKKIGEF